MSEIGRRAVPAGSAPDRSSRGLDIATNGSARIPVQLLATFLAGAGVGVGGMIGLGGAEFRLPLLIGCSGSPHSPRLAALLLVIAAVLLATHFSAIPSPGLAGPAQILVGVLAGVGIGVVAALMGVAGGELLIPTIVLLYGLDIRIAGSLSLAVSLPTMLVAFARYSRDAGFLVLRRQARFVVVMTVGSVAGVLLGGLLLGVVPDLVLVPILAALLVLSAIKIWTHGSDRTPD